MQWISFTQCTLKRCFIRRSMKYILKVFTVTGNQHFGHKMHFLCLVHYFQFNQSWLPTGSNAPPLDDSFPRLRSNLRCLRLKVKDRVISWVTELKIFRKPAACPRNWVFTDGCHSFMFTGKIFSSGIQLLTCSVSNFQRMCSNLKFGSLVLNGQCELFWSI